MCVLKKPGLDLRYGSGQSSAPKVRRLTRKKSGKLAPYNQRERERGMGKRGSCKCWSCCACWRHSRFGMRKEFSINFNFKSTPCRRLQPESAMASSVIILAFRCVVCSIFPSLCLSLYLVLLPSVCLALACSQLSESMRCRDALALSFKPAQLLADSLSS